MTAEEPTPGSRVIHRFPRIATDARSVWPHEGTDVRNMGVVVGGVVTHGETAETLAGVVRLLRRDGQLTWVRAEVEGPRSPRQLVALACITCREPFSYDDGTTPIPPAQPHNRKEMIMNGNGLALVPKWYTVAQVASLLGYGESRVRMLIIGGDLRSLKDGRSRRILPEWVDEYVQMRASQAEATWRSQ